MISSYLLRSVLGFLRQFYSYGVTYSVSISQCSVYFCIGRWHHCNDSRFVLNYCGILLDFVMKLICRFITFFCLYDDV